MPRALIFAGFVISHLAAQTHHGPSPDLSRISLHNGWAIQSSAKIPQTGGEISSAAFDASGWYRTSVPTTIVAALVANHALPDPYFGMNMRSLPGATGDIGDNLSNLPFPPDSPFAVSWWYRTAFKLAPGVKSKRLWLNFDSINYRANIWLNGRQIARADQVAGTYRSFEFDVTGIAVPGGNTLAVEVIPPSETDLSITFVDWNPLAPDKDMGVVRDVYLLTSGPVALRNVQVVTRVENTLDQAHLTLYADLNNASDHSLDGTLSATIGDLAVNSPVHVDAGQSVQVVFTPAAFPQLNLRNPELWWPYGLGPQALQQLHMEFATGGSVSDQKDVQFGIREFSSELDAQKHRLFRVNGKPILIRGGGWTHDMMLRVDDEREENELRYVREMHLNTLRLEGKMLNERFFDLADRYGILVMPGWCCCAWFEQWEHWQPEHYLIAGESLRSQLRRLRNHASVFVFLYGSDVAPDPPAERVYLNVLAEERWPHPYLSSATDSTTVGNGFTGVKMTGPYDWVSPNYWLEDTRRGGAWGFNTETSPGHAIPLVASLREMLPTEHLWPIDEFWNFHAATPSYPNIDVYNGALEARYGPARDLEDYVSKSQLMSYEGERAMFEAYGRNKYTSATGVIQWMLNNAWPSIVWHLYDWYLRPGGGYFGARKANEPLHVQYSYDDRSVAVVNSRYQAFPGYSVTARVFNFDLTEQFSRTVPVNIAADSAARVFFLPPINGLSKTYFVRIQLRDPAGALVSSNFYWLSTQPDVVDFNAQVDYRYTPVSTFADFKDLQNLPPAQVKVTWNSEQTDPDQVEHITAQNSSTQLALMVHLTVLKGKDGGDIAPIYWEDNYFELLPGESRDLTASYPRKLLGGATSYVQVDGWNLSKP